jgi:5-methyltetrahydropteroyltriglutamate--homocysteine methyltransferase
MQLHTGFTGPFPRPEVLVQATRDLDRGRTTPEAVDELFHAAEAEVVALEERLGVDHVTGGYLRWADLFRPFAETWGGFTVGPVTRWFETNTFYRQPILHAPPERVPGAITGRRPIPAHAPGRTKVILPGPYTFVQSLENRSGETPEALTYRLGRLLAEEVHDLAEHGISVVQFQEPSLVVDPPHGAHAEAVVAAYQSIAKANPRTTTILWTYFAGASDALPLLARLPVAVVGVDLAETEASEVRGLGERQGLGLGCIDPRTTLPENPNEVTHLVREITTRLHPPSLWLGAGGPLDLLPFRSATRKVELLARVRAQLDHPPEAR